MAVFGGTNSRLLGRNLLDEVAELTGQPGDELQVPGWAVSRRAGG